MKSPQLSFSQLLRLALAESRGAGKRFVFFVICLAIGVGAIMTIKSFSNILEQAIQRESKALLAADIEIKSSWPQSPEDRAYQKEALPPGTEFLFIKELHAMTRFPDPKRAGHQANLLVELKSVPATPPFYPFYGTLVTNPSGPLSELLADHGALVEPNFLVKSNLKVGDRFQLGEVTARITAVIEGEPDRISRAFSIGPRVMVSNTTLEQAKLIAPGSRVKNKTLVHLPESFPLEKGVALLERGLQDKAASIRTYKDMESSLTGAIDRMSKYLGSVGVIALLMGGIGVAMIIRTFMAQKMDTIAILNCLGATSRTVLYVYLIQALLLGLTGSLTGVGIGYALQYSLPEKMSDLLNLQVNPGFHWEPAVQSLLLGLLTTMLFTVWPLIRAVRTRPLRLFRHIAEEEELSRGSRRQRWTMGILFSLGLVAIVFWQAESIKRGLVFLSILAVSTLLLAGVAILFLKAIRKMPPSPLMTRRYGLANLYRPNNQAVSIITALGMGIMLVLSIHLIQMDMIAMLNKNTENKPPNYFFIDIQKNQVDVYKRIIDSFGAEARQETTPLVRSRLFSIDGNRSDQWDYKNRHAEEWFINREFVLTYRVDAPPDGNEVIKGEWWTPEEGKQALVSLEEDAARRLDAHIGSELVMDIQGIHVSATVHNIRRVDWRNMRTNFYMVFSPGALEGAPVTFVSTVYVPRRMELQLQQAVVDALPNVTALGTRDIVESIENVVNKLLTLVDFMSAFAIASGLFILSGAVASTKFRRLKEAAILKTLGARRRMVAAILGYEYGTLGVVAAAVGVLLSIGTSWAVMEYIVKSDWHFRMGPLGWSFLAAFMLTTITGILSSVDVLRNKPIHTLRRVDG
ncbi:putative ABC-type transport system, permease component [Nitrospina gracilis 3/211]|uniref:Putative ABC-type transport system, permease component n=1 Tax=Nitrospina gracilis (strain 3/211) TaxID=1266370 RepID=M1YJ34_NITG3|nr:MULTISPECIES: FtsX-like permease family protein [Nitrospina]MCF8723449.1 putative ABC transport system permease protein [Nitrospina sp. Nb-3]CCQ90515.1 putative ABC-type transport system, permease component [Nitrospina gracilis 3/211]